MPPAQLRPCGSDDGFHFNNPKGEKGLHITKCVWAKNLASLVCRAPHGCLTTIGGWVVFRDTRFWTHCPRLDVFRNAVIRMVRAAYQRGLSHRSHTAGCWAHGRHHLTTIMITSFVCIVIIPFRGTNFMIPELLSPSVTGNL